MKKLLFISAALCFALLAGCQNDDSQSTVGTTSDNQTNTEPASTVTEASATYPTVTSESAASSFQITENTTTKSLTPVTTESVSPSLNTTTIGQTGTIILNPDEITKIKITLSQDTGDLDFEISDSEKISAFCDNFLNIPSAKTATLEVLLNFATTYKLNVVIMYNDRVDFDIVFYNNNILVNKLKSDNSVSYTTEPAVIKDFSDLIYSWYN